jgi:hypothetical protein
MKCERLRLWDENGVKHKCENCKKSNRHCGPGVRTKRGETGSILDYEGSEVEEEADMADKGDVKEVKQM